MHSDIRSCCRQSAHVFTSRYDSTLLGRAFFTPKVFWMSITYLLQNQSLKIALLYALDDYV